MSLLQPKKIKTLSFAPRTKEKWFHFFALHCGISEANVSFLCCTCAESLVHNIHLCTDVWRGTQCFGLLSGNRTLNVREPKKMKKKWKLNFQLLSSLKPKNEDLEACYGFLSVGTYKATPNSIEKNQPRHTKLAQP